MMDFAEHFCNDLENIFNRRTSWDYYVERSLSGIIAGNFPQLKSFLLGNEISLDADSLDLTDEGLHALPDNIRIMDKAYIRIEYAAETASVKVQLARKPAPSSEDSLMEKYGYGARLWQGTAAHQALLDSEAYPGKIAFDWKNNCAYLSEHEAMYAENLFLKREFITYDFGEDCIARKFFCTCARHDARQAFRAFLKLYRKAPRDFGFTVHACHFSSEYDIYRDPPIYNPSPWNAFGTPAKQDSPLQEFEDSFQRVFHPHMAGKKTRWDKLSSYLQNRKGARILEPFDCVIKFFRYYLGERWFES